ncbi:MAG: hypothetical protein LBL46_03245 [Rickettsiales bacterium]|nr:hypothetical protein [Rickettsiales bacterium]
MKKILLLLALAPTAAPAAKLCRIADFRYGTIALNNTARLWATGVGCSAEQTTGMGAWETYVPRAEKTGTDVAAFCTSRRASGTFKCIADAMPWIYSEAIDDPANGKICICNVNHLNGVDINNPSALFYMTFKAYGASQCNTFCGYHCARYFDTGMASVVF